MKRNYTARLLLFLSAVLMMACHQKRTNPAAEQADSVHQPEHQWATVSTEGEVGKGKISMTAHAGRDTSLNYLLKPVNEQVIASIPTVRASNGSAVYLKEISGRLSYDTRNQGSLASRVSGRIEKIYIRYNYQSVKKGQLVLSLYSPDLAAAQRELLLIQRLGQEEQLLNAAKQKLMLLGMSPVQIKQVLRTGQVSYSIPVYSNATGYIVEQQASGSGVSPSAASVSSGASGSYGSSVQASSSGMDGMGSSGAGSSSSNGSTAVAAPIMLREGQYLSAGQRIFSIYKASDVVAEFFLHPAEVAHLSKGAKVIIQRTANRKQTLTGRIGMVVPVINAGENFISVRVYLKQDGLQVGEQLTGQLPFYAEKSSWLPQEALLSLGNQAVVFKKEGRSFIPKVVKTGIAQNNQIQVLDDISGWDIAKNAWYLVDSESFIKVKNKTD